MALQSYLFYRAPIYVKGERLLSMSVSVCLSVCLSICQTREWRQNEIVCKSINTTRWTDVSSFWICSTCTWRRERAQGRNHGWKVEGDQGLGPNTGAVALGVGCGRGSPPPAVGVRGYHPRKIFENSDAESCILATTCCEISCFLKTTAKTLGWPIHCRSPT